MRALIFLFILASALCGHAQPGPFGEYEMSFTLIDEQGHVVQDDNERFKVYPTYQKHEYKTGNWIEYETSDVFRFDRKTNRFSFFFEGTPAGPAVLHGFSIHVVRGADSMTIANAANFIEDTFHFRKGFFLATAQFLQSKSLKTYGNVRLQRHTIYDYDTSMLATFPYFEVDDKNAEKLSGAHIWQAIPLPGNSMVSWDTRAYRYVKGNMLEDKRARSYSSVIDETELMDNGLVLYNKNGEETLNYEYEKLDTAVANTGARFSLRDAAFKKFFAEGINWDNTNGITLAVLGDLKMGPNNLLAITLNHDTSNRRIYVSKDKGMTWKQVLAVRSASQLILRISGNKLYAFTGNRLYSSDNEGASWSPSLLKENSFEIRDVVVMNDTCGFLLSNSDKGVIVRFNPQTGAYTKLIGNVNGSYVEQILGRHISQFYAANNILILKTYNGLLVSKDLGNTWNLITNECAEFTRGETNYIWQKGKFYKNEPVYKGEIKLRQQEYVCQEQRCLALMMTPEGKLKMIYTTFHNYSYMLFSELRFKNL